MCVFQFWFLIGFKQIINKAESESNNKVVFETGKILSNLIQRSLVGQAYRQAFQRFIPISVSAFSFSFRHSVSAFYPNPSFHSRYIMQSRTPSPRSLWSSVRQPRKQGLTLLPLPSIVFILSNFKDLFSRPFTTILSLKHYSVSPRVPHVTVTSQTSGKEFRIVKS